MLKECEDFGLILTIDELKQKMKSSKQKFQEEKKKHTRTGSKPSDWEHFQIMQDILGHSYENFDVSKNFETIFDENTNESFVTCSESSFGNTIHSEDSYEAFVEVLEGEEIPADVLYNFDNEISGGRESETTNTCTDIVKTPVKSDTDVKKLKKQEVNVFLLKEIHKSNEADEKHRGEMLKVLQRSNEISEELNNNLKRSNEIQQNQLSFFKSLFTPK